MNWTYKTIDEKYAMQEDFMKRTEFKSAEVEKL